MAGRKPKDHVRREIRLDATLDKEVAEVRQEKETLTDQIEDGLRRHIRARKSARKRQKPST